MSSPFDPTLPEDIAGVLARFEAILAWSRQHRSRLGYFAALYRGVTLGVRNDLATGTFDDPQAAERLAIRFAGRYFEALAGRFGTAPPAHAWQASFDAAERWLPTVSQHLLLGINAHINLDLGIAAARTLADASLTRADFERVNERLLGMIDEVQTRLARIWPLLRLLDRLAGRLDEALIGATLVQLRAGAWTFAQQLHAAAAGDEGALIAERDRHVAGIGLAIARPKPLLRLALGLVRLGELRSVSGVIDLLEAQSRRAPAAGESGAPRHTPCA